MVTYCRIMPTALLSVYDKTGIVEFAADLHRLGWRVVSSGGTAKAISAAGTPVTDLAELTGVPAILDHRVVTLHPKIHGGLLADPTKPSHQADMAEYGIEADRSGGVQPVSVRQRPEHRADRHRRPGDGARRSQEPPVRRGGRRPGRLPRRARRTSCRWVDQRSDQTPSGTRCVRADRRIRRADRDVVRRRPSARDHAPVDGQGAVAALRREPASVRRSLSHRGPTELVGRCRAARRQGDELPQPVRHRGGVAPGAAFRCRRHA